MTARKQPADRRPKAQPRQQEQPQTTEHDYDLDPQVVMRMLGIEPSTVVTNTARIAVVDNKVILEYTVRRAVPPRIMGVALVAAADAAQQGGTDGQGQG